MGQFIWRLWFADSKKEMLHLFFEDKSLRDWLVNLPLADLAGIKAYLAENGIFTRQGTFKLDNFYFGIHIPYENTYRGYAFHLMNNQQNQMVLTWSSGENLGNVGWISDESYKRLEKNNSKDTKLMRTMFRLAINTIAYMTTFPECIKDGVPKQIKEPNLEKSFIIQIAGKVNESAANSETEKMRSPHFRCGYFKRLKSDFYTHKKGQTIFVSETMVDGKAKIVYTADNLEEIETLTNMVLNIKQQGLLSGFIA